MDYIFDGIFQLYEFDDLDRALDEALAYSEADLDFPVRVYARKGEPMQRQHALVAVFLEGRMLSDEEIARMALGMTARDEYERLL